MDRLFTKDRGDATLPKNYDNATRMANLYYAIGYYRKQKGLSQEQLAERLGDQSSALARLKRQI